MIKLPSFPNLHSWEKSTLTLQIRKLHLQNLYVSTYEWASLVAQMLKNLPAMQETWLQSLGRNDPLEKGMATHSSISLSGEFCGQRSLVGYSPWGHKVRHDWMTNTFTSLSILRQGSWAGLPTQCWSQLLHEASPGTPLLHVTYSICLPWSTFSFFHGTHHLLHSPTY